VSITPDGTTSVQTSPATIAGAVQDGDFSFTEGVADSRAQRQAKEYEVFAFNVDLGRTIYSANGLTISTAGEFSLNLTIDLAMQVRQINGQVEAELACG